MIKMTFENADQVLDNIKAMIKKDKRDGKVFIKNLNQMLDDFLSEDFFGTEGQLDPRGDWRDDE